MAVNELYMTYISHFMVIAELLIEGYCFCLLARSFLERNIRAAFAGNVFFLTMLALYIAPLVFYSDIAYMLGILAALLAMCLMERGSYGQKVFMAVTFFTLRQLAFAMTDVLHGQLYAAALNTDYMAAHPDKWFALYLAMCILWLALLFMFLTVSIRAISKNFTNQYGELSKRELLILALPPLMGVLGFESLWHYRTSYLAEGGKHSDLYDALAFLYCVAAVIAIVAVIVLYQDIRARQEEKLQNGLLAAQVDSMRRHMEQVESLYQNIRGIRHDMTNHIMTLERLYAGNQTEEAKAYTSELKAALAEVSGNINSGSPVTDVILQEMQSGAEKRGIRFEVDFHYPAGSCVNAFDVSVILHNALQNALENAGESEKPYISILSYRRNNAYMIEIRNSFAGGLRWDNGKELPITTKEKPDGHGYGLANVRKMARKYSGDIDIALRDGEFCLSIMLMLE